MAGIKCVSTVSEIVEKSTRQDNGKKTSISSEDENEEKRFTCRQKSVLAMLATVDFMSFCSMSIMAPFYPKEAALKGMTETMSGFVFGFYALVIFLSSPVFGKILPRCGVKILFVGGVSLSGLCSLIFGTLHKVDDLTLFTFFSFAIRGLEALGTSSYQTASYVAVVNIFPNNDGAVRGILETFVGLGMSVGPAMGGLFFEIGGFGLPFYIVGLVMILIAPLYVFLLPTKTNDTSYECKSGSFTKLIRFPSVIITSLIIVIIAMSWSFFDPIMEPHLRKFDLSPGRIGLMFLFSTAVYGIFSPACGWITDKTENYWWLMSTGLFLNFVSLSILGPSSILSFIDDSIWLNVASLCILGASIAMSLMPTYRSLLDSAAKGGFEETLGMHSLVAGLWSSVYSLGEMIGPVLGGALYQNMGFEVCTTVFALLNLFIAIFVTFYFALQRKKTVQLSSEEDLCKIDKNTPQLANSFKVFEKDDNGKWI